MTKKPLVKNIKFYSEGKRSKVYTATYKNKKIAIKKEKKGIEAKDRILNESKFLKILNKHKIGPKFIYSTKKESYREFIPGKFFIDFIKTAKKSEIKDLIKQILEKCYILDSLKINKLEMHHPIKHIIVTKNKKVRFIDFERCYFTKKPKNLTQVCQFLMSKNLEEILKTKRIKVKKTQLITFLKKNKNKIKTPSEIFKRLF